MHLKVVKYQRGFSLIEVLIALLVLSIGLLGMGALTLTSLQNVHSSAHYSVASAVVLDFEELLWLEVARTVVSGPAALDANGCIKDGTIGTLADTITAEWNAESVQSQWAWSNAERFRIPGLSLDIDTTEVEVNGVDKDGDAVNDVSWKMIPVTLSWDEERFSDNRSGESYTADITIVCRPIFL